jgi:Tn3 transposase DDE domain
MMKYATAIRLRTASTEALLRRFTSETTHPAYAAMLEVGRAQRSIFLARWLRDRDLQRETESGLNVVENYNGVNDYIRFGERGELASNRHEEQELGMLCLHILQSSLGQVNTLMIQDTLARPEWADVLTDAGRRGLTPVFHTNMTPYGEIQLRTGRRLDLTGIPRPRPDPGAGWLAGPLASRVPNAVRLRVAEQAQGNRVYLVTPVLPTPRLGMPARRNETPRPSGHEDRETRIPWCLRRSGRCRRPA